jgi:DNA-binding NtrC family response regulator
MPPATPTAIDGWSTNHQNNHARPGPIATEKQENLRVNTSKSPTLIGQSPVMKKLFSIIERVAPTDASVLITGATGTGKELAARAIHDMSPRRDNAFVDINCSAIPETLIEAELFGHQRGTFTGAHENRSGLFEKASGGTLFLDEVDALNLSAQAKLLRVLQERTVRRIGARANIAIDVRIISATNCDLAQAVAEGRFRPDLYYRLRVLPLHLPELCSRGEDVRLLVEHFLRVKSERNGQQLRKFTAEAMRALCEYPWPGNVRELENTIEYALAIGLEDELGIADLPPEIMSSHSQPSVDNFRQVLEAYMNDTVPLAEIEKRYILSVLQQFGGNQVRAAAALGIDRSKLYRRLKQYGVMAVRFLQEEDLNGMQLLSRNENEKNGIAH